VEESEEESDLERFFDFFFLLFCRRRFRRLSSDEDE
jgi:hypothetical protein